MKKISLVLLLAMIVVCLPACKRDYSTSEKSVTVFYKDGSTVTKTFEKTAPLPKEEAAKAEEAKEVKAKAEKMPKLFACKAKSLIRKDLKEKNLLTYAQTIPVGYYECNDLAERANLYKLAANHIIKFQCDEILYGEVPTYWVTVELTLKGKLMQVNKPTLYPEDKIDWDLAKLLLSPVVDQDEWGIPTYDDVVDPTIVTSMHAFYMALAEGMNFKNSLLSADMKCAMYLLETLKAYDEDRLEPNPFYRNLVLTPAMVDSMQIMRMPRLENGYMITLGDEDFLFAISLVDGLVEIEDLVAVTPKADKRLNPTVCSIAGCITEADILRARAAKRQRDELKRLMELAKVNVNPVSDNREHFDMCNINKSGIALVEHSDPTMYELAKKKQKVEFVQLRAAKVQVKKVRDIKVSRIGDAVVATGVAVIRTARVTAPGRIYMGLKKGTIERFNVSFVKDIDEGWKLVTTEDKATLDYLSTIGSVFAAVEDVLPADMMEEFVEEAPVAAPAAPAKEDDLSALFDMAFDF